MLHNSSLVRRLVELSTFPSKGADTWLISAADGAVEFMRSNGESKDVVVFASLPPHGCLHGWLMPYDGLDIDKASKADVCPSDTWSVEHNLNENTVWLSPRRLAADDGAEQIVYRRHFEGSPRGTYAEVSQKLAHTLQIHFVPERGSLCRFDANGDYEDVIHLEDNIDLRGSLNASVVTILANDLHEYMALVRCALVRRFDFTRFDPEHFIGWEEAVRKTVRDHDLFYQTGLVPQRASYIHGVQIIWPRITLEELETKRLRALNRVGHQYEKFVAKDLRTGCRIEASCSPSELSNYYRLTHNCQMSCLQPFSERKP